MREKKRVEKETCGGENVRGCIVREKVLLSKPNPNTASGDPGRNGPAPDVTIPGTPERDTDAFAHRSAAMQNCCRPVASHKSNESHGGGKTSHEVNEFPAPMIDFADFKGNS